MSESQSNPEREQLRTAAQMMAAARRVVGVIQCAECGREVVATTAGAPNRKRRYCSAACNQRAYYRRHNDAINARQRATRQRQRAQPSSEQPPESPASATQLD